MTLTLDIKEFISVNWYWLVSGVPIVFCITFKFYKKTKNVNKKMRDDYSGNKGTISVDNSVNKRILINKTIERDPIKKNDAQKAIENCELSERFLDRLQKLSNKIDVEIFNEDNKEKRIDMVRETFKELNEIAKEFKVEKSHHLNYHFIDRLQKILNGLQGDLNRVERKRKGDHSKEEGYVDSVGAFFDAKKWIIDNFNTNVTCKDLD